MSTLLHQTYKYKSTGVVFFLCIEKVMAPTRNGQSNIYNPSSSNSQDLYDVPPMRTQGVSGFYISYGIA